MCLSPLTWVVDGHYVTGRWLDTFLPTLGWAVFIVAVAAWAVAVSTSDRDERTHRHGGKHELQRLD